MVKARIKGVNQVRKRLADGSWRAYHHHRATGTALPGKPGDPAFMATMVEAEKIPPKDVGNVNALIREYLLSLTFSKRAVSTQREYKRMLAELERKFGKLDTSGNLAPRADW